MTRDYQPIDPARIRTYSVSRRTHKASAAKLKDLTPPGACAWDLIDAMPDFLGARALKTVAQYIADAVAGDRPVVTAFGAHVIKVGCAPILIDLIERNIVKAIACNGACAIHDMEMAMLGETSEEVADTIRDGTFGMVDETMRFFDRVVNVAADQEIGLGQAVGKCLVDADEQHAQRSIFAAAYRKGIPATVHVALGTDTIHVSSGMNGDKIGKASMIDFRLVCDVVADLGANDNAKGGAKGGANRGGAVGGVWLNIGSAVLLPEVFLKAVSVARNLGANLDAMKTANFDMIRHYRPQQNVVTRPVSKGHGHEIIGHHEILLPILRQAVIDMIARSR
ncbi:MAG: GSU2086 family protein [Planctomycetota bacterium]|jgi:hypothetical protein